MHEVHPYRKAHPHSRLLTMETIIYLGFVVFLFLLCGIVTNANPAAVLLAFFPALVFGIVLILLVETDHFHPAYNWLVLVMLLVIGAIIYFAVPSPIVQGLDTGTVLVMNAIIMSIALFIIQSSYVHEKPVLEHKIAELIEQEKPVQHTHIHIEQPQAITDVVQSIEDKIKALNFVIGRVYSVYHGGTDRMRNKIRIDKAWYDDFNQIPEADIEKRKHEAIVLLEKIKERLHLLQKTERDVFGDEVANLKNIHHDAKQKIIDVLIKNDKDPAQQYYDGALNYCDEALKTLKK